MTSNGRDGDRGYEEDHGYEMEVHIRDELDGHVVLGEEAMGNAEASSRQAASEAEDGDEIVIMPRVKMNVRVCSSLHPLRMATEAKFRNCRVIVSPFDIPLVLLILVAMLVPWFKLRRLSSPTSSPSSVVVGLGFCAPLHLLPRVVTTSITSSRLSLIS